MEGTTLGAYRIESELGSGGMGKVYLAEVAGKAAGLPVGTLVALKVVHPHLLSEPGFFKRFLREAEIGKAVTDPNVVRCYDCDQLVVEGTAHAFLVMEYVKGQTLRSLLEELETVPEELCRHIGREVSKGLAAIHRAGVVHRDLKPENVLITPEHDVKIMDLGVARLADEAIRLSQTGAFVGSLQYAAPEQFRGGGEGMDGRADLHALGLILYELASGNHPYIADDVAKVVRRVIDEKPRRLGELNPQLSPFFEEAVHHLLEKDREERFASAKELEKVLTEGEDSTWWGRRALEIRAETKRPLRRIRIPRETAVYGREEELEKLEDLYEQAKAGDGRVVLIEGEAGIGKSRLIDELIGRLHQEGEDLNFLFGSYPPGGAATAAGAWSTAYREQFGAEGLEQTLRDYLAATPILIPAFAAFLRGEPPPEGKEPLTKDSIQTVFVHATRALAKERTTIVLIEDLHFAPEEGRALFASLAQEVPEHRILLVGTTRPGLPEEWRANLERLEQASGLGLSRLGPKDLARLLEDAFHSEKLAQELAYRIGLKSDGNPFFVFEIIRGLREGKFISRGADGTWVTTKVIEDIEIPSSVLELVQARISDLDEEEQEILDVAACCGFEFDPDLVADVLDMRPIPALRRLGHLEKKHRLVRATGDRFVFDHHQVQEALYEGMSDRLRREYHAAIGGALEARHPEPEGAVVVDLCEHFLEGGRGDRAIPYLDRALDTLLDGHQQDRARSLTETALGVENLLTGTARAEVLLRLSEFTDSRSNRGEPIREALRIAEELEDPILQTKARSLLGGHLVHDRNDGPSALEHLEKARDLARSIGRPDLESAAMRNIGSCLFDLRRPGEGHSILLQACELADGCRDPMTISRAWNNRGIQSYLDGRLADAKAGFDRALAVARDAGSLGWEGAILGSLARVHGYLGDNEHAEKLATASLENYRSRGSITSFPLGVLGVLHMRLGRTEEAARCLEESLRLRRSVDYPYGQLYSHTALGRLALMIGDENSAEDHLLQALEVAEKIQAPDQEIVAVALLSRVSSQNTEAHLRTHAELEPGTVRYSRMDARYQLWLSTGDSAHLEEAHRLLLFVRDHAPEEYRETMIANVPLHRDIARAWADVARSD